MPLTTRSDASFSSVSAHGVSAICCQTNRLVSPGSACWFYIPLAIYRRHIPSISRWRPRHFTTSTPPHDPHLTSPLTKLNYPSLQASHNGMEGTKARILRSYTNQIILPYCRKEFRVSWDLGTCIPGCITRAELSSSVRHFLFRLDGVGLRLGVYLASWAFCSYTYPSLGSIGQGHLINTSGTLRRLGRCI